MGGLKKYMPITYWTSVIGSLALIGFPGTSGFFSKDALIEAVHESHIPGAHIRVLVRVARGVRDCVLHLPAGVHDLPRAGAFRDGERHHARTARTHTPTKGHAEHDDQHHGTASQTAREPMGRHGAADPAGDPVARHRLVHDRAAPVRRLFRRRDLRAAGSTTYSATSARNSTARRHSCCTRFMGPPV